MLRSGRWIPLMLFERKAWKQARWVRSGSVNAEAKEDHGLLYLNYFYSLGLSSFSL